MESVNVAILGASGYTGLELVRLLERHPFFKAVLLTGNSTAGAALTDLYPGVLSESYSDLKSFDDAREELVDCELVFSCLPHGASMGILPMLDNRFVIDLGSDFRLTTADDYDRWYGRTHTKPELLSEWVYGLPELFREKIKTARRIANPGCYATAIAAALAPVLKAGLIEPDVVVSAVSGTSGAGKEVSPAFHFSHVHENPFAYKLGRHQHTPEIEMSLSEYASRPVTVSFTPHVVPAARGIVATCFGRRIGAVNHDALHGCLQEAYADEPFVQVLDEPVGPKALRGSNGICVYAAVDEHADRVIVGGVIDNLTRGASGQALQNANILFGLDECTGLTKQGLYP